ncbi:hypothetical protein BDQ12DRAFT_673523 [Crucibulum laeve]|uniref:GLTSCR protein conserved domain-containing protein n=1 Tax=Crucibulum laeve TaxID=68775 RepID=A0A5C3MJB5_9AGAR|nr:hypothetical protein BDQ12DRAFT_673523 [Crucibulum laeve]
MSTGFTPSFNSQNHVTSSGFSENTFQNVSTRNPQPSSTSTGPSSSIGTSTWRPPSHWNVGSTTSLQPTLPVKKPTNSKKKRTSEEHDITKETAAKFQARLALDHEAVLYPDTDTPFSDHIDVVKRLLPYHVFHQPTEDLAVSNVGKGKGKEKGIENDLKVEIAETKFALECYKRREALRHRFRKARIRSAKHSAPDDQAYFLAQVVLEADRSETAWLTNELRTARAELERIEREKRAAANPTRMTQFSAVPTTHTMQPHYYRGYPYAYTQAYGAPMPPGSTPTFAVSPALPPHMTTSIPSSGYTPYQSSGAIPVQLPVASLPALHALGIVPVPTASLPPEGQPQPPAVLRGSTANGTMLSLEINVSLLQSTQMSGLAMVLNSLMSRSGSGTSGAGPVGASRQPASVSGGSDHPGPPT